MQLATTIGHMQIEMVWLKERDLKELSLCGCSGFTELHIFSRNLKILELRFLCIDKINISTEALTTLILDTITCFRKFVIINAPTRVAEFRAYCRAKDWKKNQDVDMKIYLDTEELLERFSGILSFHEGSNPIYAHRLGYISLFKNLRSCLQVRDETILNQCSGSCLYYPEHLFWEKKEVCDSISKYLRVVSVKKFSGKVLELEFLKYVIRSAPRMLRITIKCDKCCTTEETTAAVSLLLLARASMDVSVVVETPGNRSEVFCKKLKVRAGVLRLLHYGDLRQSSGIPNFGSSVPLALKMPQPHSSSSIYARQFDGINASSLHS